MLATVYNQKGEAVGKTELPKGIFEVKNNPELMYQVVTTQAANRRKGTAHTKTRGEVSGGGKKPWRQKGTGRARAGSNRSPIWRKGGTVFGPNHDKVFGGKINKKMRRAALQMALSAKASGNFLVVVDTINPSEPKTKIVAAALANLKKNIATFKNGSVLIALPKFEPGTVKAARNLAGVKTLEAAKLNVLDVLNNKYLLLPKDSIGVIATTLAGEAQMNVDLAKDSEVKKSFKKVKRAVAVKRDAAKKA
jgi:large subunit ribosomal protein L4